MRAADEIGYRPNDLAHSLRRARSQTIGIISNDSFGRFTIPIVEALEERLADEGIAVFMCNATDDPARERQHLDAVAAQARRRAGGDGAPRRHAAADRPLRSRAARRLRLHPRRRSRRALPAAGRRGRGDARGRAPGRPRPPPHRARNRPGALRGGTPPPLGLGGGARRRRAARVARLLPARRLVGGLGPRGRRPALRRRLRRRTRSSAATTRSRAAPPTRCASAASRVPGTSPSSASTTGT